MIESCGNKLILSIICDDYLWAKRGNIVFKFFQEKKREMNLILDILRRENLLLSSQMI